MKLTDLRTSPYVYVATTGPLVLRPLFSLSLSLLVVEVVEEEEEEEEGFANFLNPPHRGLCIPLFFTFFFCFFHPPCMP